MKPLTRISFALALSCLALPTMGCGNEEVAEGEQEEGALNSPQIDLVTRHKVH